MEEMTKQEAIDKHRRMRRWIAKKTRERRTILSSVYDFSLPLQLRIKEIY